MVFNHNFKDHHKNVSIVPSTFYVLLIINLPQSLYINLKKSLSCTIPETDARNHTAHKIISVITCRDGRTTLPHWRPTHVRSARDTDRTSAAHSTLQQYQYIIILYYLYKFRHLDYDNNNRPFPIFLYIE